jgi:para-aminobenzoate synthetase component I
MNRLGAQHTPFLFVIDFAMEEPIIRPIADVDSARMLYDVAGVSNCPPGIPSHTAITMQKSPVAFDAYREAFSAVQDHLHRGDSYLLNLTCATPISLSISLEDVFRRSRAKYRLLFRDRFVVFSPEIFVRIRDGRISSYPMKGTIDARLPNAEELILSDKKEKAEHTTIVDLIRNDLSGVATGVRVDRFRYTDRIETHEGALLQVSSEISGQLPPGYHEEIGTILFSLLPAGSVTGAPKRKTVEIIEGVETHTRGYYTGVFGMYDGKNLDSGVMIRFIEQTPEGLVYKSGGGITILSDARAEYREMVEKVYVPIV